MADQAMPLFRVDALFPGDVPESLEPFLAQRVPWGWQEEDVPGGVRIRMHFPQEHAAVETSRRLAREYPDSLVDIGTERQVDWSVTWREFFEPVRSGRFLIVPPWVEPERIDPGATPIVIEPKMAFGTGHHPTTFLCLQAIDEVCGARSGEWFLDLGTGSGILGIACAKAGLRGIGLDIDPVAVDNAKENIDANGVQPAFSVAAGSLDCLRPGARFGLIVANILAHPLADMAESMTQRLEPRGALVLSGLLREQVDFVRSAYTAKGLADPRILERGEWAALVFSR
jgi:ribosomal protein L11 methyltransferase